MCYIKFFLEKSVIHFFILNTRMVKEYACPVKGSLNDWTDRRTDGQNLALAGLTDDNSLYLFICLF